ncbi:hypothetical protein LCGC14_0866060 [marine sediment metagenome]|uniref:Uncharacterized protein n=1 Tax=marine sediment metagenome TaxID=412755 RepID=A0A0F9RQP8_9ZZZZ
MAEKTETGKITAEDAGKALHQLSFDGDENPQEEVITQPLPLVTDPPAEDPKPAEPVEEAPAVTTEKPVEEAKPAAGEDDVASLKTRLEDEQGRSKRRLEAVQSRHQESIRILRDRHLRKSTALDRATKVIESALTDEGVDKDEAQRVVQESRGTMHPDSSSYVPPAPQPSGVATEEQRLVFNDFLNEQGMELEEAKEFGEWISTQAGKAMSPTEVAVANESLDGFLRLAHSRWKEGIGEKGKEALRTDAQDAVRVVQRNQKNKARAAAGPGGAPKKQPTSPSTAIDYRKMTKEDVSALVKLSVTQHH